MSSTTSPADVIVIGAGLSGLAAARRLQDAGKSVIVLEARDRAGGKVLSHSTRGGVVELGAAWINEHTQPRIAALAREAGNELVAQYEQGRSIFYADGQRVYVDAGEPKPDPLDALHKDMEATGAALVQAMQEGKEGMQGKGEADMDAHSIFSWYRSKGASEEDLTLYLDPPLNAVYGAGSAEVNFLLHAMYVATNGGWEAMMETNERGAQYQRTSSGNDSMVAYLASKLGGSVRLNTPVMRITRTPNEVHVTTPTGEITGKAAIVATGTVLLSSIDFSPLLSPPQRLAIERSFMGYYSKVVLLYEKAWWREMGLSGASMTPLESEHMTITFDQVSGGAYALTAFLVGQKGAKWSTMDKEDRQDAVVDAVARTFGSEDARSAVEVIEKQWTDDKWARGAPAAIFGPGQAAPATAFREPTGNLFWASTDNASHHTGYMEGAVVAGEEQADAVLEMLK